MVNSKHAFWQALIFTIIVFAIGLLIGFTLENSRSNDIELSIIDSEINLLDAQVRNLGLEQFQISCPDAKQSTFDFADGIYREALQLEAFDNSAKFTETLKVLHKRYDLLRILLWTEGIKLKENCGEEIHTVVYLFEYKTENVQKGAAQSALSRLLLDIKNAHNDEILLIPIAGNLDIESVELVKSKYGANTLPAIIIDEQTVIAEQKTLQELEEIIFSTSQADSDKIVLN